MTIHQKIIGGLILLITLSILASVAKGRSVTIGSDGNTQTWDLSERDQRVEFRALYGNDKRGGQCITLADYAVTLMKQRDEGTTESAHLAEVRANYEATKTDPRGAVAHHIYVDFQRMVRDIHRRSGSGYAWTDSGMVWEREVWWCIFPGIPY